MKAGGSVAEQMLRCPSCGADIPLSEAISGRIEAGVEARAKDILATERVAAERVFAERTVLAVDAAVRKTREELFKSMSELSMEVEDKSRRLEEAGRREESLLRIRRDLEDRERTLNLEVQRTLSEERSRIWEEASRKVGEEHLLKDAENQRKMVSLVGQVEELRRRLEQGSQQEQGEVQEIVLEADLRSLFPYDIVSEIGKGIRGGDCVQDVFMPSGMSCGKILWESKRTKAWGGASWTDKAKEDMRAAKADVAVIVTQSLPQGVSHVGFVEGVWVSDFPSRLGIATALRYGLVQVARAKRVLSGRDEKMVMAYEYLTGPVFRQGVQAIVGSFSSLKSDLDAERRAMEKHWARREKKLEAGVIAAAGMYGRIEGILGGVLQPIEELEIPIGDLSLPERT